MNTGSREKEGDRVMDKAERAREVEKKIYTKALDTSLGLE